MLKKGEKLEVRLVNEATDSKVRRESRGFTNVALNLLSYGELGGDAAADEALG